MQGREGQALGRAGEGPGPGFRECVCGGSQALGSAGKEGQALGGAGEGEPGLRECCGVGEGLWGARTERTQGQLGLFEVLRYSRDPCPAVRKRNVEGSQIGL